MLETLSFVPILAQDPAAGGAAQPAPPFGISLFPLLLIAIFFYFILLRPQRREQKRREELLSALKKNDKVVTVGGIIGTVANLSADGKEVSIKVDDNTKLRMLRSSIQSVVTDETPASTETK